MTDGKLVGKEVTEVRAYARGVHISPRKVRLVSRLLKDLSVEEALDQLNFLTKKAALPIKKLVSSAIANALHNFQIESGRLFIKHFSVDGGRVFFRYEPRAQGRAFPVRKRTSNLNLVLGVSKLKPKPRRKDAVAASKIEVTEEIREPVGPAAEPKKSRFAFWRKKDKETKAPLVSTKPDVKGKKYTAFDRRGNM